MKKQLAACGLVLLGFGATAQARGRPAPQRNEIVVTHLDVSTSSADDGQALEMKLDVRVQSTVGSDVTLTAITACKVNGESKVDTTELGGDLSDLDVGDTKHFEASPFSTAKLASAPPQCSITIRQNKEFTAPRDIARFCYSAGHVNQGPCR